MNAGEPEEKKRRESAYLSQLEDAQVLWPGDVRALAEISLRCHDAKDRIFNACDHGSIRRSCSTLHGLAGYSALAADLPESQIEERFKRHCHRLEATAEYDPPPLPSSLPRRFAMGNSQTCTARASEQSSNLGPKTVLGHRSHNPMPKSPFELNTILPSFGQAFTCGGSRPLTQHPQYSRTPI